MDAVAVARRVVAQRFPEASAAFLAGSVVTGLRSPTSDLDVVVVLPGAPAPYRETLRSEGWLVEIFAHTRASLDAYWAHEREVRRAPLLWLCAENEILVGGAEAEEVRAAATALLDQGPPPLTQRELDALRYLLTDLLDDLAGAEDPVELQMIGMEVYQRAAELRLHLAGAWLGRGKWLSRRLGEVAPELRDRLAHGLHELVCAGEIELLVSVSDLVLDRAGGRLAEGYVQTGRDDGRKD